MTNANLNNEKYEKIKQRTKLQYSKIKGNGCHRALFKSNSKLEHLSTGSGKYIKVASPM